MLEQDPEPTILDAWSWSQSRSLTFEFRLHSPGFATLIKSNNTFTC